MNRKLDKAFYLREDPLTICRDLLGKKLVTNTGEEQTTGRIVEAEAYIAPEDKASHAYNFKRTKRTSTMFMEGSTAYVYLCYGIHAMFNIITHQEGMPHAILVRAIEPLAGIETMKIRRNRDKTDRKLTAGPGCVSQALGITTAYNRSSLLDETIWIEEGDKTIRKKDIQKGPRVGIQYAEEYKDKPWRFKVKDCQWTSKPA